MQQITLFGKLPPRDQQEYIPMGGYYDSEYQPIVFRANSTGSTFGHSHYTWGVVYLDAVYEQYKQIKLLSPLTFIARVIEIYHHEFLHCFFSNENKSWNKDVDTYDYKYDKETGVIKKQNYVHNRSRSWVHNERVVGALGEKLTIALILDTELRESWVNLVKDDIETQENSEGHKYSKIVRGKPLMFHRGALIRKKEDAKDEK